MPKLTLYYFNGCPYCEQVKDFMEQSSISLQMKNIREDRVAREELIKIGGKPQVPCLLIDGKAVYESVDIIKWLKNNYKNNVSRRN